MGRRRDGSRGALGLSVAALAMLSSACSSNMDFGANGWGGAGGFGMPVAHNAEEAFPNKPASVPVLTPEDIVRACAIIVGCSTQSARLKHESACIDFMTWSAERAIPILVSWWSNLNWNERAEYFAQCTLAHAGDCAAVEACGTTRKLDVYCEEDGCDGWLGGRVTCNGSVATVATEGGIVTRDCARAYAACDPSSPTGCTDRHFTACPPGGTKSDHCDGNVRLGCDRSNQVSYHDCARMGGVCGLEPDGQQGCIYNDGNIDPQCQDLSATPRCIASTLQACVLGQFVSVAAPRFCQQPLSVEAHSATTTSGQLVPGSF